MVTRLPFGGSAGPRSRRRSSPQGPLYASFVFQFEGQPMGLLTHQVMVRKGPWRSVGESRFVPPDADPASPAFVEWRREGENWVISQLGDETFVDVPLPAWVLDY